MGMDRVVNVSKYFVISAFLVTALTYCSSGSNKNNNVQASLECDSSIALVLENNKSNSANSFHKVTAGDSVRVKYQTGEMLAVQLVTNMVDEQNQVHWVKDYGPDAVCVSPNTGLVVWNIPKNMPSESFHIGIKASTLSETVSFSFIVHAGDQKVITVGKGGDYDALNEGMAALESGSTLVILDGEYEGESNYIGFTDGGSFQHPASGTELGFTTIMAKTPGEVVFKDGAYIELAAVNGYEPVSYVAFKGLFIKGGQIAMNGLEDGPRHHHLKFIRNGVEADERIPFNAFRSDNILFENNYAFGGGRYKFASYEAENIVWRRNVARYDRGTVHDEPKGTYSVYSTMDALLSNNLAIDGNNPDFVVQGEIAGEFATPTTSGATRAKFKRNMQINSAFMFTNLSYLAGDSDVELSDMVSWHVRPDNSYVKSFASGWLDHITMGDVEPRNFADQFFNGWDNNFRGVTNSIIHDFKNGDMFYSLTKSNDHKTVDNRSVERYGADTNNITNFDGKLEAYESDITNLTYIDPIRTQDNQDGSLMYLTRTESKSNLSESDKEGNTLGATVLTFLGFSGTLYGEAGYDSETGISMWPFPMEDIIQAKFSKYTYKGNTYEGGEHNRSISGTGSISGEKGFAVSDQTLTNYIWGYLGNVVPPFNVTASIDNTEILLQWSESAPVQQSKITGYNIYKINENDKTLELIKEVDQNNRSALIEKLRNSSTYRLAVTALSGNQESGIGMPVTIKIQ